MTGDRLQPGGALSGDLFKRFLERLSERREPRPGERVGPYRIRSELGRGGSGVVFLAERIDGAFRQQVALKWLRGDRPVPGGRELLARERELLASLDHPHIARLIDGGESADGQLWFAMDYVPGDSIDVAVADLGLAERLRLVHAVCRAVHHAHRHGLIHGDIKPANVRIDERGRPRLLDFGIARMEDAVGGGSYGLTPEYASPEQRRGETLTTASDVWQLGRLLSELLHGVSAPADLHAVSDRAMAASPEARYPSAAALAADLDAWLGDRPVSAYRGGFGYRFCCLLKRNRAASVMAAAALLALSGGALWATWQLAAERDLARLQAERAEAALAETEAALARAGQLRDFLIGLFRAAEPDRPRAQLPETGELLDLGAARALDQESAPAHERLGMLVTIAEVYLGLGQTGAALPLLEAATGLTDAEPAPALEDRVRLLAVLGHARMSAGDFDAAEANFIAAEELAGNLPRAVDASTAARARRGWLYYMQGRHDEALDLLQPLKRRLDAGELSVRPVTRLHVDNSLASVLLVTGDLEQAVAIRARIVEQTRRLDGPESRAYAIQLNNLAAAQIRLGRFERARQHLHEALALYDRMFDGPVVLRAAARANLSNLLTYSGQFEAARSTMTEAAKEWAATQGRDFDDYEFHYYHQGRIFLREGRDAQARQALEHARALYAAMDNAPASAVFMTDVWLARALCRQERLQHGWSLLEALDPSAVSANPVHRADWHESRALCLHSLGRTGEALAEIQSSLALADWPGFALHRRQRAALKAEILQSGSRPSQ